MHTYTHTHTHLSALQRCSMLMALNDVATNHKRVATKIEHQKSPPRQQTTALEMPTACCTLMNSNFVIHIATKPHGQTQTHVAQCVSKLPQSSEKSKSACAQLVSQCWHGCVWTKSYVSNSTRTASWAVRLHVVTVSFYSSLS